MILGPLSFREHKRNKSKANMKRKLNPPLPALNKEGEVPLRWTGAFRSEIELFAD